MTETFVYFRIVWESEVGNCVRLVAEDIKIVGATNELHEALQKNKDRHSGNAGTLNLSPGKKY